MNIDAICDTILDESSSADELRMALDSYVQLCGAVTAIQPDPGFSAWADDALLDNGVAINPQAAANCALDYQRSVIFIRGVNAAIIFLGQRFPNTAVEILYAGCGPFATLLLPLLGQHLPKDLNLHFLDFHQRSLDSVEKLIDQFGFQAHRTQTIKGDACSYRHNGKLHLIIAETMQKSLEQEPQFAVTANLAPQMHAGGVFVPQCIDVSLRLFCSGHQQEKMRSTQKVERVSFEKRDLRCHSTALFSLSADGVLDQMSQARVGPGKAEAQLDLIEILIPDLPQIDQFDAALCTRISVFGPYRLEDYESEITLPLRCNDILPLAIGERYRVSYQLGSYPKFHFERSH